MVYAILKPRRIVHKLPQGGVEKEMFKHNWIPSIWWFPPKFIMTFFGVNLYLSINACMGKVFRLQKFGLIQMSTSL